MGLGWQISLVHFIVLLIYAVLTTPASLLGGAYKLFGFPEETAPWNSHFVGTRSVVDFSRPLPRLTVPP